MYRPRRIKIQDIDIADATQRTITIVGGKGTGKTTLIKMLIDSEKGALVFDPLNVIKGKNIEGYRIPIKKETSDRELKNIADLTNQLIHQKKNVVIFYDELLQEELIKKTDTLLANIKIRDGFIFVDEIHEFTPQYKGSTEMHRAIRHWRNKNIGFVMSTQRPASVNTSVIGMTDYLILFRITWKNDLEAIKEIVKHQDVDVDAMLKDLQKFKFMEGYAIDFLK